MMCRQGIIIILVMIPCTAFQSLPANALENEGGEDAHNETMDRWQKAWVYRKGAIRDSDVKNIEVAASSVEPFSSCYISSQRVLETKTQGQTTPPRPKLGEPNLVHNDRITGRLMPSYL